MLTLNTKRESGIELLKILSLFIIIICHVYSTFTTAINPASNVAFFDETLFSPIEYFIYQIFITFGYIGNMIFFVCSSWFLIESKHNKLEKIISIWLNTLIISILFLIIYYLLGYKVTTDILIKCLFPIINENNWYITAYIMFYAIYPFVNIVLDKLDKKKHLFISITLFLMYFVIDYFFIEKAFYKNDLIMFVVIYVIVAYIKKYMNKFNENISKNIILLIVSLIIFYAIIYVNFAIMPINIKWHVLNNPFFLLIAITLINIFVKIKIKSSIINTVSALSLYVYLIHDNILFRDSIRSELVIKYIELMGVNLVPIKILSFSILLFVSCLIISYVYCHINGFINKISDNIKSLLTKKFV